MNGGLLGGAILKNLDTGMSARQMRNFQHAMAAAEMSDFTRSRVGAVLVDGKHVLSVGFSTRKTSPWQELFNKERHFAEDNKYNPAFMHAEIHCLAMYLNARDIDLSGAELYVCRLRRDQPFGMSRPCPACMAAIKACGIRRVAYTTNDGVAFEKIA